MGKVVPTTLIIRLSVINPVSPFTLWPKKAEFLEERSQKINNF